MYLAKNYVRVDHRIRFPNIMIVRLCIAIVLSGGVLGAPTHPCNPNEHLIPITDQADCAYGVYYVCDHDGWKRMTCRTGQVWDADVNACVEIYPGYQCSQQENSKQRLVDACRNKGNLSVVDPYDCGRFISCHNGEYRDVLACPGDLYFDEGKQYCDYKVNVKCIQLKQARPVTQHCVPRAHPRDCNRFIECDRKKPIERQCEFSSTYYSNRYKVCVWKYHLTKTEIAECGLN